jgi:hypothetical protein
MTDTDILLLCSILTFPALFITICYHTTYAVPWIFPPLAFYGFDLFLRMCRARVKDAELESVGGGITLVSTSTSSTYVSVSLVPLGTNASLYLDPHQELHLRLHRRPTHPSPSPLRLFTRKSPGISPLLHRVRTTGLELPRRREERRDFAGCEG